MAGVKRKQSDAAGEKPKKVKADATATAQKVHKKSSIKDDGAKVKRAGDGKEKKVKDVKEVKKSKPSKKEEELVESDTTESEEGFYGTSAQIEEDGDVDMGEDGEDGNEKGGVVVKKDAGANGANGSSSRESHIKQKALAKERKLAKPHADDIQRSKKLWERLRRKSHVPKEERAVLVKELFEIITGRVKDFVFKHDSVRVIQCALKYSNPEQRKSIARELKGSYKELAESKYAKFLVGKVIVEGDAEGRDMVISEFYGHVRRMINHPEASWILDDIYRGVATPKQKGLLLREWYGPEFAIFRTNNIEEATATLSEILEQSPEKRKPIMHYLHTLINQLVQKKLTGFTMLHDAMLQYFLNTKPGSEEATEFLELIKGDDEGDLLKNLAFTKSGSRVVALAFAYGSAKDRKNILRVYRENMEILAFDPNGHHVLLAAMDVTDDTVLVSKAIFPELLATSSPLETQQEKLLALANDKTARLTILYPLCGRAKWLFPATGPDNKNDTLALLDEIHAIRQTTSKKDPEVRSKELRRAYAPSLLTAIAADPAALASTSFGCQLITEALLSAGDAAGRAEAVSAVADLAKGDPEEEGHPSQSPHAGRMFKALATGGRFDPKTKSTVMVEPRLGFGDELWERIKSHVGKWATGGSSFTVVALVEAGDGFEKRSELLKVLKKEKKVLERAAKGEEAKKGAEAKKGNAGARILLEKLG
ncbi:ARM repeat-containing protein [Saccharata proteae CBS 121410]|uniref:ARM repeat-containing protein n=1 Tax=Saccharata proteae CBS 121410 TaxID=1314787 RepID=A0A6A5YAQ6_9PEZI|nr:ARM repeat-containing protein [Saccharata proteae CBS 121410]